MPRRPRVSEDTAISSAFQGHRRRLDKLEQPDGNQLSQALIKIQTLLANVGTYVTAFLTTGVVKMPTVYTTQVTSAYRVVYNGNGDGTMGYNLSSRRFKQDIEPYAVDPDLLRRLRIVTFRYIEAVERLGDDAFREVGLIAEEVDALGLRWLVDYDEEGRPEGLKFDRLAVAALALAQDVDERLREGRG